MAKSVNKVFLWGKVDKNPEIQSTPNGAIVANFTLATSDRFQDAQGNWQDRTEWHNLVAFKRTAEIIRDYVKKGSKLYIEGKIQTRSWDDKEGAKRYKTEVVAFDISLLSAREDGSGGGSSRTVSSDQRPPDGPEDYVAQLPYVQQAEISDDVAQQAEIIAKRSNRVFLLGNVGKDPDIRSSASGTIVVTFGLATSDRVQDAQGNWQDHTEWHNLVAFKRTAEIIRDYVHKGSKLYVEGKIQTRSWDDQSGQKRYKTEIIVNDLSLLSGREEGSSGAGGYSKPASSSSSAASFDQRPPAAAGAPDEYSQQAEISDDDIPF
jgi:single-strand DNA-binding protein